MRAGGCTVQQALTPEAASVVKQAMSLARRRGHAQVTPLHVANALLSSSTGLLRAACLQSHSHPLQCKALELCFNVALNRLPASSSSTPILSHHHHHHQHHHHHHHPPSLSNALVAAFKRAQAHQRRGSIESQQQPLLAVKIELEQLVISILDDPSVSRVMREAGFSSTQVKSNVEQTISMEVSNPSASSTPSSNPKPSKPQDSHSSTSSDQDVMYVIESLVSKRRRGVVLVGECLETSEAVVRAVMDKVEKGDDHIPDQSLGNLQFVTLPLFSLGHMSREEVERKIGELRCLVKSCYGGKGAVLYLGDLKWVAEYYNKGRGFYCPVEHMIMEIGRLLCGISTSLEGDAVSQNFWLMGIATYQTYIKCRSGSSSLESLWALHPLTIPSASLGLSLNYDNSSESQMVRTKRSGDASSFWSLMDKGVGNQLNCCSSTDYSLKYDTDNHRKVSSSNGSVTTSLPSWLQQYKEEKKSRETSNDQDCLQVNKSSCKNWNSICSSSHKHHHQLAEMTLHFSSCSPSSSSISSHEHHHGLDQPWLVSGKHPWREHHLWLSESVTEGFESSSMKFSKETKGFGILKPNPLSTSSSDHTMEMDQCYHHKFRELNAENLKTLCNALEKKVSWHKDIIPEIASTILRCRSGMMRRKERIKSTDTKEDTWLFFQGGDGEAKEKIARELANLVFGSNTNLVTISLNNYSSTTKSDSSDNLRNKRVRSEASHSYLERFFEAIKDNHHRVFLMEDLEQIDYCSQLGIKNAIERGRIRGPNGEEASVGDAILILSCENFDSRSRACSPPVKQKSESHDQENEREDEGDNEVGSAGICLDLNLCAEEEEEEAQEDVVVVVDDNDVGLLESVDRSFFFNLHEDL